MSTPIDDSAGWLAIYQQAKQARDAAEETMSLAREKIEAALGDHEIGTIAGVPVVTWKHQTQRRFDQKIAKEIIPADLLAQCYIEQTSRRFTIPTSGGDQ